MPSAVCQPIVTGVADADESVKVNVAATVPPLPSVTEPAADRAVGGGRSSFTIVTVVEPAAIEAPIAPEIWTLNVSFDSETRVAVHEHRDRLRRSGRAGT